MKLISSMEEARKLKPGEPARWKPGTLKLARGPVEDERHCLSCRYLFYAEKPPRFCPGCGARWNGRTPARGKAPVGIAGDEE